MKLALLVIFGGKSTEHEISNLSAYSVLSEIDRDKYNIYRLGITKDGKFFIFEGEDKDIKTGQWEKDEKNGVLVKTPSDKFKWNQLGELYKWFTGTYGQLSLEELKARLEENINSIYKMIDSMSAEELFNPHMRKWADEATKTATWEVYKFIHVNTVAPFGTFRTKIRKWKKLAL